MSERVTLAEALEEMIAAYADSPADRLSSTLYEKLWNARGNRKLRSWRMGKWHVNLTYQPNVVPGRAFHRHWWAPRWHVAWWRPYTLDWWREP